MNCQTVSQDIDVYSPGIMGEMMSDAVLSARDMCYMNFAREEFNNLHRILWPMIEPLLCNKENTVAGDIARHLEQIRSFSGNFCWRHRHLGASLGVVGDDKEL